MMLRVYTLISAAALTGCSLFAGGCASGDSGNFTPLSQTVLNRTYRLTSSSNTAHIGAFVGPINNTPPHAQKGADYYSDANAVFNIVPDSTGNMCTEGSFSLTGRLTNPEVGNVYLDLSGSVGGGTMTLTGLVDHADSQNPGIITGTYKISGGTCDVPETQFTNAAVD